VQLEVLHIIAFGLEGIFSCVQSPARPVLEPVDDHVVGNSFFPGRYVPPEFLPSPRPRLAIQVAPGPALQPRDVAGYFGVGSFIGGIPAEEVPLRVRSVRRRRWGAIPLSR
jgi:hypothetical protein